MPEIAPLLGQQRLRRGFISAMRVTPMTGVAKRANGGFGIFETSPYVFSVPLKFLIATMKIKYSIAWEGDDAKIQSL
jgi:hypothetical protein